MASILTFTDWYQAAKEYALTLNYCLAEAVDYLDYYDGGYTPEEAVREDISYCE